ncbi:uncharacterized protein LOC113562073 [Ooceraea biroi]|uniref:Retrotransposon gag domain-containing protein n=1 Tax=Ooceraea biroi TaxID=2015173 RepID=A0A026WQN3_OOCBI|nr:uncharacterized protein LOC113562073 [Ooceraea biroi]EZA57986.1 hypothetical protein X777_01994 [Ooceraea biroi]
MQSSDTHGGLRGPAPLKVIHEGMDKQWQLWLQAFEFYATATQLDKKSPSIQVATFMAMLGQEALIIYNTFELADTNDIARIKELFSTKFAPKQNESYTSWLFHKLKQEALETFDEFLTKAQTMVKKCEYGGLESRMFRDKIVFGVHSDDIREKLFAEPKLDLERAILICRHAETAARQLQNMKQCDEKKIDALRKQSATTNKARLQHNKKCDPKQAKETRTGYKCRRCNTQHERRACPAYDKTCHKCNTKGDYSRRGFIRGMHNRQKQQQRRFVARRVV